MLRFAAIALLACAVARADAPADRFPDVAAAYWVEVDGRPLWAGQPDRRLPMASLAKLMTTLVHEQLTEVFIAFGERGLAAEDVARTVFAEMRAYEASAGAVGPHLADQLALPLALAVAGSGRPAAYTCTELTEHSRTNFAVIERFLDVRFDTRLEVSRAGTAWRVDVLPGVA